jgi:predicted MFS family arabinose efflux permease
MVVMSLAYAFSAYPVGIMSDDMNKKRLLAIGLLLLILADLALAQATSISVLMLGVALWGLHMGFSQGILATMVAEATPQDLKVTAYGLFNFITGLLMLFASLTAGWLWESYGSEFTFYCGAVFSFLALSILTIKQT